MWPESSNSQVVKLRDEPGSCNSGLLYLAPWVFGAWSFFVGDGRVVLGLCCAFGMFNNIFELYSLPVSGASPPASVWSISCQSSKKAPFFLSPLIKQHASQNRNIFINILSTSWFYSFLPSFSRPLSFPFYQLPWCFPIISYLALGGKRQIGKMRPLASELVWRRTKVYMSWKSHSLKFKSNHFSLVVQEEPEVAVDLCVN